MAIIYNTNIKKNIWVFFLSLFLAFHAFANDYLGTWEIKKVENFAFSLNAPSPIGAKMIIAKDSIKIFERSYAQVRYQNEKAILSSDDGSAGDPRYSPFYGIGPKRDTLNILDVYLNDKVILWLEILSLNELLYRYDGNFYFLKRISN